MNRKNSDGMEQEEFRERCYHCLRPVSLCFCDAIPEVANRTKILILQHLVERSHAFNTARIVHRSLARCELVADHTQGFATRALPIEAGAGLLFPSQDSLPLEELPVAARPRQLVVIDGTWHQAKTIVRDVESLRSLPRFRLTPARPGQYRIRREPNEHTLSTVEATVAALKALEPSTAGLDQLLAAFERMVDDQLERLGGQSEWRRKSNSTRKRRYLPHALLDRPESIVVAYGESTPSVGSGATTPARPVNWLARRLGQEACFSCLLQPVNPLQTVSLRHMRIQPADFQDAATVEEFRERWSRFLRPRDTLIVFHQRTCQLLKNVEAELPNCLVLKSIFGIWQERIRSMEQLCESEGLSLQELDTETRASYRLRIATALVEHLRRGEIPAVESGE